MKTKHPDPHEIRRARLSADLTQAAAAGLVYSSLNAWSQWERGERKMHPAIWELFLIKSQQIADINNILITL
ncbi:helix-turn-helix domain-containing protein [Salmonella enterica]|nr:helix-turn-helix domain-containing protein [Salmonella enterica]